MTAGIGHNGAPEWHEAFLQRATDLKEVEGANFLDGSDITSQAEAEAVAKLITEANKILKETEAARKELTKPLDETKKVIMDQEKEVIKPLELVKVAASKAVSAWETKQEVAKREAERIERERLEAERKALEDAERDARSLEEVEAHRDAIEAQLKAEKALERQAKQHTTVKGVSFRTVYDVELVDATELLKWMWAYKRPELQVWAMDQARKEVRATSGKSPINGVKITKEKVAV